MFNKITKEEFDIYNYVSDNLEEYINNKKLLKKTVKIIIIYYIIFYLDF